MFLKIGLLILLLLPAVPPQGRRATRSAVEGKWQIDKVRSVNERKENLVWTIGLTRNRVTWVEEYTKDGAIKSHKLTYFLGDRTWKDAGSWWTTQVEFDEDRLVIRQHQRSPSLAAPSWDVFEFEVKDHGHTLYHKHTIGRDVAVHANERYFRPVAKNKK